MGAQAEWLKRRTKTFAVAVIGVFRTLPRTEEARTLGRQLLRSATSIAANYRAVCRARSKAEFAAKMGVVVEEADETLFWLELLVECGAASQSALASMVSEANELLAIFAASYRTAKSQQSSMMK